MTRCCLCRGISRKSDDFERTDLPGSGWRCMNHDNCAERVREIIAAHVSLAEALQ